MEVNLNGIDTKMEVDTRVSVLIIVEDEFKKWQANSTTLCQTNTKLFTYIHMYKRAHPGAGATEVQVKHNGQVTTLPLIITQGQGPSLGIG